MLRVFIFLALVSRVFAGDIQVTAQREVASDGEVVISWRFVLSLSGPSTFVFLEANIDFEPRTDSSDSPTYTVRV